MSTSVVGNIRLSIGNTRITHRQLISRNDQQQTCANDHVEQETHNKKMTRRVLPMERYQRKK